MRKCAPSTIKSELRTSKHRMDRTNYASARGGDCGRTIQRLCSFLV